MVGDAFDMDQEIIFSENEEAGERCPEYDEYWRQKQVPTQRLINDGWRLECEQCYTVVDNDYWDYENDVGLIGGKVIDNLVLCSSKCVQAYNKEKRIRQQIKAVVHSKWPRVRVAGISVDKLGCYLDFGGMQYANWDAKNSDSVLINPKDKETWENFNAK